MRLATRAAAVLAISICLVAGISVLLVSGERRVRSQVTELERREGLIEGFYQLRILSLEFEQKPSERTIRQWNSLYGRLASGIGAAAEATPEISESFAKIGAIFEELASGAGTVFPDGVLGARYRAQRMAALHIESQRIIDWAVEDTGEVSRSISEAAGSMASLVAGALAVLCALVAAVMIVSALSLLRGFRGLGEGLARVAKGNFEGPMAERGPEEIRRLAKAYNQSLASLREAKEAGGFGTREGEQVIKVVLRDLGSPLMTLKGLLSYLATDTKEGDAEGVAKNLERISGTLGSMEAVVNELRRFLESGSVAPTFSFFPMREALDAALAQEEALVAGLGAETRIGELPEVYADRGSLVVLWRCLIENALKFAREGSRPILEAGAATGAEGPVFHLRDEGIGIESRHWGRIFELFGKLDPHSSGTGLGLSIARRIVEAHGGRIWVESRPGEGSTFLFTLGRDGRR